MIIWVTNGFKLSSNRDNNGSNPRSEQRWTFLQTQKMKVSLINCVVVFVVGWIGGLLFIQYCFDAFGTRSKSLRADFTTSKTTNNAHAAGVTGLLSTLEKGISYYSLGRAATPAPTLPRKQQHLPRFAPYNATMNSVHRTNGTGKEDAMYIFLGWPMDDRLFTVDNYKALESMLNVYPTATFRCLLATSRDAYSHKIGNTLAHTQFSKYKKRQYNINVMPLNTKQKSRTSSIGEKYREKWYESCCGPCNAECRAQDHTQPYHFLNYVRLTHLWQNGGIFSDFSFFFLGPITSNEVQQGYVITSWCGNQYHMEQWQTSPDSTGSVNKHHDCATSTLLMFNNPQHEAILCVLSRYDDPAFLTCIESDEVYGGAGCVKNAFDKCFESLKLANGLVFSTADAEDTVLENFEGNAFRASNTLQSFDWSLDANKRVFWMGSLALTGSWKNYPYRNGTLMAAAVQQIALRSPYTKEVTTTADQCKIASPCHHYAKNLSILASPAPATGSLRTRFRPDPKYSFHTGIEEVSCTPSVVIAGFMKSASSFLYHALARHPSVLPALRGAQYKETHCYSQSSSRPDKLLERPWCFPFVEDGEPFVSIDGTVAYDIDQQVPYTMREDNPHAKVIFVVRNPVERLYSHYKFSYNTFNQFGNFDEFIGPGMDFGDKFGNLREMVTNGTAMEAILSEYYNGSYRGSAARGALFMHSLYALPVAHYVNVFGRANVKVVSAEDLDVQDPVRLYDTLNSVFRFIGVCPVPIADLVPSLPSRNLVPLSNQMSQDMYVRLTRFFRPFNELLMSYSELNVTHWNTKIPPAKLPKFSPLNKTMPDLWFEIKEAAGNKRLFKGELTAHLLPQRTSVEDSGYNTTLGMLNTF